MKIIYFANARIPTEKAHGFQIMKMCASFAAAGADVTLVIPNRKNNLSEDPFLYYALPRSFKIRFLPTMNILWLGRFGFYIQTIWFALACFIYGLFETADVYYSRDESTLVLLKFWKHTVLEVHNVPTKFIFAFKWIVTGIAKFVSTNQWKADFLSEHCGINDQCVLVFPNAVDIPQELSRETSLKTLGLDSEKKYVVYTGHLYAWKGAHILAQAAGVLPQNVVVIFVGGSEVDVLKFKKTHAHGLYVGHKQRAEVLNYLAIADVVVLPNIPSTRESIYATSPMKLFEYMAAQKPIVASDLPSIREIIDEKCAVLVSPGDPALLAEAINLLIKDPQGAADLAKNAFERVQSFTWEKRAHSILNFISR